MICDLMYPKWTAPFYLHSLLERNIMKSNPADFMTADTGKSLSDAFSIIF